ncbi:hypothetical protein [Marinomonas sp.]|uniref:hypothetical protein n=1 Tax=Marinomonas sp. TaxID=1904862 RepID=UPI003A95248E
MNPALKELQTELVKLKTVIDEANLPESNFEDHGWNYITVSKTDLVNLVQNTITKIVRYGNSDITTGLEKTIKNHIENIKKLTATSKTYLTNNANHILHIVPKIILTVVILNDEVNTELYSLENADDKKLIPRSMKTRLRSLESNITQISDKSLDLDKKVTEINEAHQAAEALPTDLENLKSARRELKNELIASKTEVDNIKAEIKKNNETIAEFKTKTNLSHDESIKLTQQIRTLEIEAKTLVAQCTQALHITTTEGLSSGFEQKAKQLKNSIWVWIFGLLIALVSGAVAGSYRITALSAALENDITTGQAIIHTIILILTIAGPFWLAWISTQQINQRFKLSEDYYYKATVAKSFTGFKKFAEDFDDLETEKRLFNSTMDRFDEMPLRLIEGKNYNSPWHELIDSDAFNKAIAAVPALASEAIRFAGKTKLQAKSIKVSGQAKVAEKPKKESVPEEKETE